MTAAPLGCDRCRELAPELALGIAEGDERAAALEHLAGCAACRREVAELAGAADALLLLAPSAEPPAGFETRALASFSPAPRARRPRQLGRVLAAAAAVVVLGLAVGIGVRAARSDRDRPTSAGEVTEGAERSATVRMPGGAAVGRVTVHEGSRASLTVRLAPGAPAGTYVVQCDYEAGAPYRAGTLVAAAGANPPWRATVDVPVYDLTRVRLVSSTGGPNLEAELPA